MTNATRGRRLLKNANLVVGTVLVMGVLLTALLSLAYTPYSPTKMGRDRLQPPSQAHLFGTDQFGRDTFSRVMKGSTNSLLVGTIAVGIGLVCGILVGTLSGYFGGWLDEILMRIVDVIYGFPAILMAILITSILGHGIQNSMIAIGLSNVPVFARLTRGSFLSLKQRGFVSAARALGRSHWGIINRHILPNSLSPLLIQASSSFAIAILAEAALSYLGLGTQPPQPSWGSMLLEAQALLNRTLWPAIFPGLAIALAVLGFNVLGDGLRDALDPRAQERN